jgi:hypothetical protein
MTAAERALIEAAIEERRLSHLLDLHQFDTDPKWWRQWEASFKVLKRAVRRVVKERKGK